MKMTFDIDPELAEVLERYAEEEGRTIKWTLNACLAAYLEDWEDLRLAQEAIEEREAYNVGN